MIYKKIKDFIKSKKKQLPEVFCKKGVLKNFIKFTGYTYVGVPLVTKFQLQGLELY